jgi:GMP synthase PP-ATPase subunit
MLLLDVLKNNPNNIVLKKVVEILIVNAEKIQLSEMMTIENILAALASVKKQEEKKKVVDESFINFLLDKLNIEKV